MLSFWWYRILLTIMVIRFCLPFHKICLCRKLNKQGNNEINPLVYRRGQCLCRSGTSSVYTVYSSATRYRVTIHIYCTVYNLGSGLAVWRGEGLRKMWSKEESQDICIFFLYPTHPAQAPDFFILKYFRIFNPALNEFEFEMLKIVSMRYYLPY